MQKKNKQTNKQNKTKQKQKQKQNLYAEVFDLSTVK